LSVAAEKHVEEQVPFIGNLCDINRPTVLADKFCSLYTDEYTDAMEVIERSMDEADAVHVMLEWLKVCNTKAMEVIERSMDEAGAVHVMLQ
jgi:benzoyl-CoA reductase/2-hydroxyglutaryl-CoA dehydratase subunit BcrC/BadD/HgdB